MRNKALHFILFIILLFSGCETKIEYLPQSIYQLSLNQKYSGEEAERFVNRLHFGNVAAESNEIGMYAGAKGQAIIYVSYYKRSEDADSNLMKMVQKISPQNSVFTGGESFELENVRVYRYSGMGQTHFVFAYEDVLVWISADPPWAESFLQVYLQSI